ncbi:hypothetical protein ACTXT7_003771 [Hymenolepis weldensis]
MITFYDPALSRLMPEESKHLKLHEFKEWVKILVPNSTAGMIIGKNGSYIQEIKERSEAYVQISQKSREFSLPERCVIVADARSITLDTEELARFQQGRAQ